MNRLVRIGNVRTGLTADMAAEAAPVIVSSDVYATERTSASPTRVRHRPSFSPTYEPSDVGAIVPLRRAAGRGNWSEKEILPGLRIAVVKGQRWSAERLNSGQVLLTPVHGQGEDDMGALMRDTDGFTREIADPIPQPGGSRW